MERKSLITRLEPARNGSWHVSNSLPARRNTRLGDELARQRRELPWVRVEKEYRFDTDDGEKALGELFDGHSQLLVYHFMFGPSYQAGDPVNSSMADTVNGVLPHLRARDVSFVFVSKRRWRSCRPTSAAWAGAGLDFARTDFNFDLGFSFTEEQAREAVAEMRPTGLAPWDWATADRRAERPRDGHRRRRLPHREPRLQYLRTRRRRRLPHVLDDLARIGVPDGLLPDPRPRTEGPRRGRGVAALAPPARRVRGVMTLS